jgi:hypothetical protein
MTDFEKLGVFYLGRRSGSSSELILYDSKDLTTHGVIVGMTGSGKTGLAIGLIEEAAIDGIPTIAIDPKGDLGNLLLTFPDLRPDDFAPWVEEGASADAAASSWAKGLASWGQGPERIKKLREAVEMAIYTPGSTAGRSISILRSLAAPPAAVMDDEDARREKLGGTVSGLLALLGIEAASTSCSPAWSKRRGRPGRTSTWRALSGTSRSPRSSASASWMWNRSTRRRTEAPSRCRSTTSWRLPGFPRG